MRRMCLGTLVAGGIGLFTATLSAAPISGTVIRDAVSAMPAAPVDIAAGWRERWQEHRMRHDRGWWKRWRQRHERGQQDRR